jgi:hypothetical protein
MFEGSRDHVGFLSFFVCRDPCNVLSIDSRSQNMYECSWTYHLVNLYIVSRMLKSE